MKISPTALPSVVMLVVSVGAIGIPTVNVNVMNFPTDEQGNLLVTVAAKPSQRCLDSMETTSEISLDIDPANNPAVKLPFIFYPKAHSFNITKMWVSVNLRVAWAGYNYSLSLTLNEQFLIEINYRFPPAVWFLISKEPNPSAYSAVTSGINVLEMSNTGARGIFVTAVSIFIEYEYMA